MFMKKIFHPALAASMALLGGIAVAAPAAPLPVRGTITAVNGSTLAITETSGAKVSVQLAPNAAVVDLLPSSLADVKAGSYIGTAAIREPSGTYRAMELQVFPESMRGVGLGTRRWNLKPHSTMTNGTVGGLTSAGGTVSAVNGSGNLTLTVNDGKSTKTVLVPAGVPVVTYAPGTTADLQPGAHVIFFPTKAAGGTLTTSRINVGKNGLVPPM
jgi:hypothetical protein